MVEKRKEKSYLNWVFTRWYFWVIVVLYTLSNRSLRVFIEKDFTAYLGALFADIFTIFILFSLVVFIISLFKKKEKKK